MNKPTLKLRRLAEMMQDGNTDVYLGSACAVTVRGCDDYLGVRVYTDTKDGVVMQTFRLTEDEGGRFARSLTRGLQAALIPLTDVNGRKASVDAGIPVKVCTDRIDTATHCLITAGKGEGIEAGMYITHREYFMSKLAAELAYDAIREKKIKARLWKVIGANENEWVLEETVPPQKAIEKEVKQ